MGPADGGAAGPDPALRPLVIEIGTAMIGAGDAVEIVEDHLRRILAAYRVNDAQLALLPTSLFVEFGGGGHAGYVQFASGVTQSLRLDQIAALYQLVHELEAGDIHPAEGRRRLVAVYEMAPRFAAPIRTIGHAVLTAGLALLLVPTWEGVLAALVLGFAIGTLKLASLPTLRLILPIAAAALSSILVFAVAHVVDLHDPVRLLVAPLATFIPGSVLAIATIELAAGQIVSGASRLVSGLVQLALLAFGIVAGAALVHAPRAFLHAQPSPGVGSWVAWVGVIVFGVGIFLHFSAPVRSFALLLAVLVVAFSAQRVSALVVGGVLSGFFGALAMTPLALWIDNLRVGTPKLVTFLPAFWLLVPGATGLVGVTQLVGTNSKVAANLFADTLGTIAAISLGVLLGAALYQTAHAGARRVGRLVSGG